MGNNVVSARLGAKEADDDTIEGGDDNDGDGDDDDDDDDLGFLV